MAPGTWIIGSADDCDLVVSGATVSGRHCRLMQQGDSFLLEDLQSTNGTFVDGERVDKPRLVRRGQRVTLGQSVAMPWPPPAASIVVGRLPDNDVVIPLDVVSSRHCRLEREGNQVFLVDLGSTNGTSINDPLHKITRAPLQPTDAVFLGTHRVPAATLLAALPPPSPPPQTLLEAPRRDELQEIPPSDAGEDVQRRRRASLRRWLHGPAAWGIGISLSALCLVAVFAAAPWRKGAPRSTETDRNTEVQTVESTAPASPAPTKTVVIHAPEAQAAPDEKVVRAAEKAVVPLGLRIGSRQVISNVSAWAVRPDQLVAPTGILDQYQRFREKHKEDDVAPSACTPDRLLGVLRRVDDQEGLGFSVVRLEGPLEASVLADLHAPLTLAPAQRLAALHASARNDDPKTISRSVVALVVERVERNEDSSPRLIHCSCASADLKLMGAPVFDGAGRVVGCVQSTDAGVLVLPILRLRSLMEKSP